MKDAKKKQVTHRASEWNDLAIAQQDMVKEPMASIQMTDIEHEAEPIKGHEVVLA